MLSGTSSTSIPTNKCCQLLVLWTNSLLRIWCNLSGGQVLKCPQYHSLLVNIRLMVKTRHCEDGLYVEIGRHARVPGVIHLVYMLRYQLKVHIGLIWYHDLSKACIFLCYSHIDATNNIGVEYKTIFVGGVTCLCSRLRGILVCPMLMWWILDK